MVILHVAVTEMRAMGYGLILHAGDCAHIGMYVTILPERFLVTLLLVSRSNAVQNQNARIPGCIASMHHVNYHEVQAQHLSHPCSYAVCLQYAHDARTKELSDHRGYRWTCKTLDVRSSIINTKSATFYSS
jgi:hypothetical protein